VYVEVGADRVALREPDDVTRFQVAAGLELDDAALDSVLRDHGVGYLDGDAAFIGSSWLRDHGEPSAEWAAKLGGMLAYAATKGWIRDGHVQAHVERGRYGSSEEGGIT
jgi:hypothetical protein